MLMVYVLMLYNVSLTLYNVNVNIMLMLPVQKVMLAGKWWFGTIKNKWGTHRFNMLQGGTGPSSAVNKSATNPATWSACDMNKMGFKCLCSVFEPFLAGTPQTHRCWDPIAKHISNPDPGAIFEKGGSGAIVLNCYS